jgi:hypothetical protein
MSDEWLSGYRHIPGRWGAERGANHRFTANPLANNVDSADAHSTGVSGWRAEGRSRSMRLASTT